jgi:hypothetical protein
MEQLSASYESDVESDPMGFCMNIYELLSRLQIFNRMKASEVPKVIVP